jgi:hypothetical protein
LARAFRVEFLRLLQRRVGQEGDDRVHLGIEALDLRDVRLHHLGGGKLAGAKQACELLRGFEYDVVHRNKYPMGNIRPLPGSMSP